MVRSNWSNELQRLRLWWRAWSHIAVVTVMIGLVVEIPRVVLGSCELTTLQFTYTNTNPLQLDPTDATVLNAPNPADVSPLPVWPTTGDYWCAAGTRKQSGQDNCNAEAGTANRIRPVAHCQQVAPSSTLGDSQCYRFFLATASAEMAADYPGVVYGAHHCEACDAGKLHATQGTTSCGTVTAGYVVSSAASDETVCPIGRWADAADIACELCTPGTSGSASAASASSICVPAVAGRFINATGTGGPIASAGSVANSILTIDVNVGTDLYGAIAPGTGNMWYTYCDAGTYASSSTACTNCSAVCVCNIM